MSWQIEISLDRGASWATLHHSLGPVTAALRYESLEDAELAAGQLCPGIPWRVSPSMALCEGLYDRPLVH